MEGFVDGKFNEDEAAERLERDEIVVEEYGLIDRDFELKPFLSRASRKSGWKPATTYRAKTVNLLVRWVPMSKRR